MIDYEETWLVLLVFRLKGSVMVRAACFAVPAAVLAALLVHFDEVVPNFRQDAGIPDMKTSQIWSAATAVITMLLGYRTSQALSRFWEGTSLLHQMRGEWFDSVSCCVTFTSGAPAAKSEDVRRFRHTLIRLMSLCHGSALEEIKGDEESDEIETIDVGGLDIRTLKLLHECKEVYDFNRVELLLHMCQTLITKATQDGTIMVAPPIVSRVYQTLSRGFVNLLNAKKIVDTKFPFPYAQLIAMLLILHVFLTPMMMSAVFESVHWAAIFSFLPVFGMFSLCFVAQELENPFGDDDNDLPLNHFQTEMNKCLLMLLHHKADHVADISSHCLMDFELLASGQETNTRTVRSDGGRSRLSAHEQIIANSGMVASESSILTVSAATSMFAKKSVKSFISEAADAVNDGFHPGIDEGDEEEHDYNRSSISSGSCSDEDTRGIGRESSAKKGVDWSVCAHGATSSNRKGQDQPPILKLPSRIKGTNSNANGNSTSTSPVMSVRSALRKNPTAESLRPTSPTGAGSKVCITRTDASDVSETAEVRERRQLQDSHSRILI